MSKARKAIEVRAIAGGGREVAYSLRSLAAAPSNGQFDWTVSWPGHSITQPVATDLLEIGKAIYLADRAVRRSLRYGQRTRRIDLVIPVLQPDVWRPMAPLLESLARFASADLWTIKFDSSSQRVARQPEIEPQPEGVVALFSGGLDSLCGAAWLARRPGSPVFVTHSPPGREACLSLVQDTWKAFRRDPLPAASSVSFRLEVRERTRQGTRSMFQEPTRRTRPFFFLSLACAVAVQLGIPNIQMSENGAYALSLPFRADAHGALCSRQAHAYLLDGFRELLSRVAPALGAISIYNPFQDDTKGEECQAYLGPAWPLAKRAISCEYVGRQAAFLWAWKKKHTAATAWIGDGPQCGLCMPCLVRRAALYRYKRGAGDEDRSYFFNARLIGKQENKHHPPLYSAAAAHVHHVQNFCRRIQRMSLDDFAVQYLPELRLPQRPEFLSDEALEKRYRLVRRFAGELMAYLETR